MEDFNRTISIRSTDKEVYDAITAAIPKWWTAMYEGKAAQVGDVFTVRFGPSVFKTIRVEELLPYKKIVWRVTDTLIDIPELSNKTEWLNTQIIWEIESQDTTTLKLTHVGLTPQIECYTICEGGWESFIGSLVAYVETGTGRPFSNL